MDRSRYADLFLTESREHLSAITQSLLELERTSGGAASVGALFRSVHTIKGMSATMGYTAVAELAHELEALLDRIRAGLQAVTGDIVDLLFASTDALERAIEISVAGREDEVDVAAPLARLRALAQTAAQPHGVGGAVEGIPSALAPSPRRLSRAITAADPPPTAKVPETVDAQRASVVRVRVTIDPASALPGVRGYMVFRASAALGEVTELDPPMDVVQTDAFQGEMSFMLRTGQDAAAIERAIRLVGDIAAVEIARHDALEPTAPPIAAAGGLHSTAPFGIPALGSLTSPFGMPAISETPVAPGAPVKIEGQGYVSPLGPPTGATATVAPAQPGPPREDEGPRKARHIRIDLRRLDSLMNLIGELVITRGRLTQIAGTINDEALGETVAQASRLVSDLQDEIMTSRMVPVWQVFDRFPRLVRDAARALGKQVSFSVEGKEIELDRSMLDEIGDPIVHLLRNAIDHGIERPEDRVAAGKPPMGRLTLSALRDRSAVIIRVSDDGKGIDRRRVLQRAKDMQVIDGSRTELSDEELIRLISRPGFSTAETVTNISGRGVGVDAVQTRVRSLGGTVDIRTAPGEGTTVTVRLPLTLAIVRALLAKVGDEVYALPMTHVNETVELDSALLQTVKGREVLVLRDEVLPLMRLRSLLRMPTVTDERRQVVVLEIADRRAGLIVDELTGQQEIVVKQFDGVRDGLPFFSGATILGDGAPALIVDVGSLI